MNKQIEALTKHVQEITMGQLQVQHAQVQQVAAPKCDLCGEGHANGKSVPERVSEEAYYMGN